MNISKIDFNDFIGQVVKEINTEKNLPLGMIFSKGGLIIECPWRIRIGKEIKIWDSDCRFAPDIYSHKVVEKLLLNKEIENILFYENFSLLTINFRGRLSLDLFHDSNYFEGWQLNGNNGFELTSLPGGCS